MIPDLSSMTIHDDQTGIMLSGCALVYLLARQPNREIEISDDELDSTNEFVLMHKYDGKKHTFKLMFDPELRTQMDEDRGIE